MGVERTQASANLAPWVEELQLPELTEWITESLDRIPALDESAAQLDRQLAEARKVGASSLPSFGVTLQGSRSRAVNEVGDSLVAKTDNSSSLVGSLSWSADIWGRLSDQKVIAALGVEGAELALVSLKRTRASAITNHWLELVSDEESLGLAKERLEIRRHLVEEGREAYASGTLARRFLLARQADFRLAEAQLQASIEARENTKRRLMVFCGHRPDHPTTFDVRWPPVAPALPADLKLGLLARRPDLQLAELDWNIRHLGVEVAQKDRWPDLTITGSLGTTSQEWQDLLEPDRLFWNLMGSLTQPIFQGGRLQADVTIAEAQKREASAAYAQRVLDALLEVNQTLSNDRSLRQQMGHIEMALKERETLVQENLADYRTGLSTFVDLQEARLSLISAREEHLRNRLAFWSNRVSLYLALGGPALQETTP